MKRWKVVAWVLEEIINEENIRKLGYRRFCCAHCQHSWIEVSGLVIKRKEGSEDVHFRLGSEMPAVCQKCGSDDVFEIMLPKEMSEEALSFEDIKRVRR